VSDEPPNAMIRRAVEHLRQESRRQPGGRDEQLLLAVATWLDEWHLYGLTDETVADDWAAEWEHAKHVASAALGEVAGA
jgi:hypothetical protein